MELAALKSIRSPITSIGRVRSVRRGIVEVSGINPRIGDLCRISPGGSGANHALAEVISVSGDVARATIVEGVENIRRNDRVRCAIAPVEAPLFIDEALAIDANGVAIASRNARQSFGRIERLAEQPELSDRAPITQRMLTRENAIDDCLPIGLGQRVGVFAEAGAGKTLLLRRLMSTVACDHVVIALIGERSREVIDLIELVRSEGIDHRVTIVAGLAGSPATTRAKAMSTSLRVAQHFAAEGKQVLHLVDSLTRFTYAARETGLSAGEPMAQSGMTPSVYQILPECLEMAGAFASGGSVTTVCAVLLETHMDDPVSSYVRSLLDGHIYLDKNLADQGIYPAVDVLRSRSRLDTALMNEQEQDLARRIRSHLVDYRKIEEYLHFSGYEAGSNAETDRKIQRYEDVLAWIQGNKSSYEIDEN